MGKRLSRMSSCAGRSLIDRALQQPNRRSNQPNIGLPAQGLRSSKVKLIGNPMPDASKLYQVFEI